MNITLCIIATVTLLYNIIKNNKPIYNILTIIVFSGIYFLINNEPLYYTYRPSIDYMSFMLNENPIDYIFITVSVMLITAGVFITIRNKELKWNCIILTIILVIINMLPLFGERGVPRVPNDELYQLYIDGKRIRMVYGLNVLAIEVNLFYLLIIGGLNKLKTQEKKIGGEDNDKTND